MVGFQPWGTEEAIHISISQSYHLVAGFQLVDGKERILVLEGITDKGMQLIAGLAAKALAKQLDSMHSTSPRAQLGVAATVTFAATDSAAAQAHSVRVLWNQDFR